MVWRKAIRSTESFRLVTKGFIHYLKQRCKKKNLKCWENVYQKLFWKELRPFLKRSDLHKITSQKKEWDGRGIHLLSYRFMLLDSHAGQQIHHFWISLMNIPIYQHEAMCSNETLITSSQIVPCSLLQSTQTVFQLNLAQNDLCQVHEKKCDKGRIPMNKYT